MCPACMATAVLMAGGLMTTGGLAALLVKLSRSKQTEMTIISNNSTQRRTEDGDSDDDCEGSSEGCAAS
jgi:hypothetical protein